VTAVGHDVSAFACPLRRQLFPKAGIVELVLTGGIRYFEYQLRFGI